MTALMPPTILTIDDAGIAQRMQAAIAGNPRQLPTVLCSGPTYVALRHGGKLLRSRWYYPTDLGEVFQAIAKDAIAPQATPHSPDTLELCFTHSYRQVSPKQFQQVFANVHRGIQGIELQYRDRIMRYSPTDMIARNLTFQKVLQRFLETNALQESPALESITIQAFAARQVQITLKPAASAVTMYRGNQVVPLAALSGEVLQDMSLTMGQWLLRQVQADGRLIYKYFPSRGQEATSNNLIRQFMATLCLIRYARFTARPDHQTLAVHNLNYNLAKFYQSEADLGFVEYNGKVKLGAIALAALAILEYAHLQSVPVTQGPYAAQFAGLCRTLETLWQPDGSFRTFLKPRDRNDNQNFYPGEALLFWASLYASNRDAQLLERCQKSVKYYQQWHQEHRNPAFVPWHTQAYTLLYRLTGDRTFRDCVFEMNDWLLAMQQWESARYEDTQGRFYHPQHREYGPPHASATGVYLEGLAEAYQLAVETGDSERVQRYQQVIWRGLRSVRQLQFRNATDLFYITQRASVHGALRTTVYDNVIRLDNVQHCLMALLKLLQFPEFQQGRPCDRAATFPAPAKLFTAAEADSLKHFRLINPQVDIHPFLAEIAANTSLWQYDTSRQEKIKVQRETNTIYLRRAVKPFPPGITSSNDVHDSEPTQVAQNFPKIMQWVETFAQVMEGELGRVTIVRLAPQGQVYRHIDKGDYYRIRDRYHLVLHSSAGSVLGAGDDWVRMQPGEFWWFDNKVPHEAYNEADDWRIHLIFDICLAKGDRSNRPSVMRGLT